MQYWGMTSSPYGQRGLPGRSLSQVLWHWMKRPGIFLLPAAFINSPVLICSHICETKAIVVTCTKAMISVRPIKRTRKVKLVWRQKVENIRFYNNFSRLVLSSSFTSFTNTMSTKKLFRASVRTANHLLGALLNNKWDIAIQVTIKT